MTHRVAIVRQLLVAGGRPRARGGATSQPMRKAGVSVLLIELNVGDALGIDSLERADKMRSKRYSAS